MTEQEMRKLAMEAAKTSVLAASRYLSMGATESVDHFIDAYNYAMQKIKENQQNQDSRTNVFSEIEFNPVKPFYKS